MLTKYILWSTVLAVMGNSDVGIHQITSAEFASKQKCDEAIELLVRGRPDKQVERHDGYVRTMVEIEGATLVNRLQCIDTGMPMSAEQ